MYVKSTGNFPNGKLMVDCRHGIRPLLFTVGSPDNSRRAIEGICSQVVLGTSIK